MTKDDLTKILDKMALHFAGPEQLAWKRFPHLISDEKLNDFVLNLWLYQSTLNNKIYFSDDLKAADLKKKLLDFFSAQALGDFPTLARLGLTTGYFDVTFSHLNKKMIITKRNMGNTIKLPYTCLFPEISFPTDICRHDFEAFNVRGKILPNKIKCKKLMTIMKERRRTEAWQFLLMKLMFSSSPLALLAQAVERSPVKAPGSLMLQKKRLSSDQSPWIKYSVAMLDAISQMSTLMCLCGGDYILRSQFGFSSLLVTSIVMTVTMACFPKMIAENSLDFLFPVMLLLGSLYVNSDRLVNDISQPLSMIGGVMAADQLASRLTNSDLFKELLSASFFMVALPTLSDGDLVSLISFPIGRIAMLCAKKTGLARHPLFIFSLVPATSLAMRKVLSEEALTCNVVDWVGNLFPRGLRSLQLNVHPDKTPSLLFKALRAVLPDDVLTLDTIANCTRLAKRSLKTAIR